MKHLIFGILFLTGIFSSTAQRQVEKTENVSSNTKILVNFKFARNIKVVQWNKNQLLVKATVNLNDGEGNEYFNLKSKKNNNTLTINSDFKDYFKKNSNSSNCSNTTEINYIVYVPKSNALTVKSISGDLNIIEYHGTLTTDLISGNITIKKQSGKLALKTISGDVDVVIAKAKINAESLTGTIYSNHDIKHDNQKRNKPQNKIIGTINNGTTPITMETISGNIYIRKS